MGKGRGGEGGLLVRAFIRPRISMQSLDFSSLPLPVHIPFIPRCRWRIYLRLDGCRVLHSTIASSHSPRRGGLCKKNE